MPHDHHADGEVHEHDLVGDVSSGAASGTGSGTSTASGEEIPEATAGPYPGDGSNGVNVLTESGIVRSDITTSFAGVAGGVPLTVRLTVLDTGNGSTPDEGAAVYPWHCDREVSSSVYATTGYEASVANLVRTSLDTDMVVSDGYSLQLATVTGSVEGGLTATLTVPV